MTLARLLVPHCVTQHTILINGFPLHYEADQYYPGISQPLPVSGLHTEY